jgi:hypothetical protein
MEAIAQLQTWFDKDKNYEAGVLIYEIYGKSHNLKRILKKGPSSYNLGKLESELQKLLNHYKIQPPTKKKVKVIRTKSVQNKKDVNPTIQYNHPENLNIPPVKRYSELKVPGYDFETLPEQLRYEWALRIKLHKERNAHHYRLDILEDIVERKNSIDIILDNSDKIDVLWHRLDYWGKYKIILPEEDPIEVKETKKYTDPFEMIKRRNNLRSSITKGRKRLTVLKDNEKIATLQQKIAHWEIEKADLELKITGE